MIKCHCCRTSNRFFVSYIKISLYFIFSSFIIIIKFVFMEPLLSLLLSFFSAACELVCTYSYERVCVRDLCVSYRVLCPFPAHVYAAKPEHKQADTPLTTSCFTSNSLSQRSIKITESRVVCAVQTLNSGREVPQSELLFPLCCVGRLPRSPPTPSRSGKGNICSHLLAMGCRRRHISTLSFVSAGGFKLFLGLLLGRLF